MKASVCFPAAFFKSPHFIFPASCPETITQYSATSADAKQQFPHPTADLWYIYKYLPQCFLLSQHERLLWPRFLSMVTLCRQIREHNSSCNTLIRSAPPRHPAESYNDTSFGPEALLSITRWSSQREAVFAITIIRASLYTRPKDKHGTV